LDEVITYSLIDPEDEARLHPDPEAALELPGAPVVLRNSLAPERSQMRRTLLPSLLRTAWDNLRFLERVAIFEVGSVYYKLREPDLAEADPGVAEPRRLAVLMTGPRRARWWEDVDRAPLDYFDLKGVAEGLLEALALADKVAWARGKHPAFHPGRCARVAFGEDELGVVGELHPLVREAFDLPEQPVLLLDWDLDLLMEAARAADAAKEVGRISNYPMVHEDLALVVDEAVPALDVQRAILAAGAPLVIEAVLFDVYRGAQVAQGRKSLAFALTYQSPGQQLSEKDVTKLRQRILKRLRKDLDATLRGA
jgi:phenylalanyl-tRNA synthetase beta chain